MKLTDQHIVKLFANNNIFEVNYDIEQLVLAMWVENNLHQFYILLSLLDDLEDVGQKWLGYVAEQKDLCFNLYILGVYLLFFFLFVHLQFLLIPVVHKNRTLNLIGQQQFILILYFRQLVLNRRTASLRADQPQRTNDDLFSLFCIYHYFVHLHY